MAADVALILEHSVEVPVGLSFAWRFRTDIATWHDPPARFTLDGPFVDGASGTTMIPNQPPLTWHVRGVRIAEAFIIEMELEGPTLADGMKRIAMQMVAAFVEQRY